MNTESKTIKQQQKIIDKVKAVEKVRSLNLNHLILFDLHYCIACIC